LNSSKKSRNSRAALSDESTTLPASNGSPDETLEATAHQRRPGIARHAAAVCLLAAVSWVTFFLALGEADFWQPDEARYAEVAREMVEVGHWIVPHNNGVIYANKPPLYSWLAALSGVVFGRFDEGTARLPSALASLGMVLLTYWYASRLYGWRTGVLSGVVLAFSIEVIVLARWSVLDAVLGFFVLSAVILFYVGSRGTRPGLCYVTAFAALSLGVLTKGPVAIVLVFLPLLIFLIIRGRLRRLVHAGFGLGMILGVLIVGGWVIPACIVGGADYTRHLLLAEGSGSAFSGMDSRLPFYYYAAVLAVLFLPWSVFLPAGFAQVFSVEEKPKRDEALFLAIWIVSILVFFSLFRYKRFPYILTAFPAAAIVVGRYWSRLLTDSVRTWRCLYLRVAATLLGGALVATAGALAFVAPGLLTTSHPLLWAHSRPAVIVAGVLSACVGIALLVFRKKAQAVLVSLAVCCVGFTVLFYVHFWPGLDATRPSKDFARKVAAIVPETSPLAMYGDVGSRYVYYAHRKILEIRYPNRKQKLLDYLSGEREAFCLVREDDYGELEQQLEPRVDIVASEDAPFGHRNLLLVKTRAAQTR